MTGNAVLDGVRIVPNLSVLLRAKNRADRFQGHRMDSLATVERSEPLQGIQMRRTHSSDRLE